MVNLSKCSLFRSLCWRYPRHHDAFEGRKLLPLRRFCVNGVNVSMFVEGSDPALSGILTLYDISIASLTFQLILQCRKKKGKNLCWYFWIIQPGQSDFCQNVCLECKCVLVPLSGCVCIHPKPAFMHLNGAAYFIRNQEHCEELYLKCYNVVRLYTLLTGFTLKQNNSSCSVLHLAVQSPLWSSILISFLCMNE